MDEEYYSSAQKENSSENNHMAAAAMIMAVISIIFCLIFYISIPLGSLAIILALLSRGRSTLKGRARTAVITACCGIAVSTGFTGISAYVLMTNPTYLAQLQQMIDYYSDSDSGSLADYLLEDEDGQDSSKDEPGDNTVSGGQGSIGNTNEENSSSQNSNHSMLNGGDLI